MATPSSEQTAYKITLAGQIMIGLGIFGCVCAVGAGLMSLVMRGFMASVPMPTNDPFSRVFTSVMHVYPVLALLFLVLWIVCIRAGQGMIRREERARRSALVVVY